MSGARPETVETVRRAVRSVVESTPELRRDPALARTVAERMVGVSLAAAELIREEHELSRQIGSRERSARPAPLARAQSAGDIHGRSAVNSAAGTLKATRDAIDFPGFVTSLISGVFQSIQSSSIQQLQAFADLLEAVNSSSSDFATTQISAERAAQWATSRFPALTASGSGEELELSLRDDAELPDAEELARVLGASEDEASTIDDSDLTETLLPLVRRKLARDRQAMLSTMLLMGLQRVVVDDGAIHASMQLQVDARSSAEQRSAEQTDVRVETEASGSFGMGLWGASARMAASVGYVKSDEQLTKEDIAVSAGLRSSVDVRFRAVPLDMRRMASDRTLDKIRDQSMVPEAERALAPGSLLSQQTPGTTERTLPTPSQPGSLLAKGDTMSEAVKAREKAAEQKKADEAAAKQKDKGAAKPKDGADKPAEAGKGAATNEPAAGKPAADASKKEASAAGAKPATNDASKAPADKASASMTTKPAAAKPDASKPPPDKTIGGARSISAAAFAAHPSQSPRARAGQWGAPLPEPERNRPT
jgi:hypothetical protein